MEIIGRWRRDEWSLIPRLKHKTTTLLYWFCMENNNFSSGSIRYLSIVNAGGAALEAFDSLFKKKLVSNFQVFLERESGVSKHPEILVFIKTRLPFAPRNLFNKIILPNYLFFEGISLLLLLKTALKVSFSSLSFKALSSYLESLHNLVASFRMSCLKQNIESCFAFGKSLVLCEKT